MRYRDVFVNILKSNLLFDSESIDFKEEHSSLSKKKSFFNFSLSLWSVRISKLSLKWQRPHSRAEEALYLSTEKVKRKKRKRGYRN
jgi:uncharacterized membrane protein